MGASILAVKVKGLSRICQFFDLRTKQDHLDLSSLSYVSGYCALQMLLRWKQVHKIFSVENLSSMTPQGPWTLATFIALFLCCCVFC